MRKRPKPAPVADPVIARATLASPALDELMASVEQLCALKHEYDHRIRLGERDHGTYIRIATEFVIWRSRTERALKAVNL